MASQSKEPFVTVALGMRGYFAVLMVWNEDLGGFWEPENSGYGSYKTREAAFPEAREWAEAEEVEFKP